MKKERNINKKELANTDSKVKKAAPKKEAKTPAGKEEVVIEEILDENTRSH